MVKSNINSNKKGNLMDFMEVGRVFLVIVVVGFLSFTVLSHFSTSIDQVDSGDNYTEFIDGANQKTSRSLDFASLAFLLAAFAFSIIMARKIPTESTYIIIVLFISFIFFVASMILSNVFGGLMDNVQISNYVNLYLPITKVLLSNFPFVVAIYLATVLIIFFNKD